MEIIGAELGHRFKFLAPKHVGDLSAPIEQSHLSQFLNCAIDMDG